MKKRLAILLLVSIIHGTANAQEATANNKLAASLKLQLFEKNLANKAFRKGVAYIPVFIRITDTAAIPFLKSHGARIQGIYGKIVTAEILPGSLTVISQPDFISRIETPLMLRKTDEKLKDIIHASQVHNGLSPLDQGYTGKNVIIGVIDDGIDFTHPDFYDTSGNCRIKYLWAMNNSGGTPPAGFQYGTEYTNAELMQAAQQVKAKQYTQYQFEEKYGFTFHGTSVSALAAGNKGVAPEADIISVSFAATEDSLLGSDKVVNAIAYIAAKAKFENKKAVVNISLGVSNGAPHDGKSMVEEAIDHLIAENPNLLVCVSAGNNGNNWKHWGGFPIGKDSAYCFFYNSSTASLYFAVPRANRGSIFISIAESETQGLVPAITSREKTIYQSPYYTAKALQDAGAPVSIFSTDKTGKQQSAFTFTSSPYNSDYDEVVLKVNSDLTGTSTVFNPHNYRFIVKGSGTIHAWFPFLNLHPLYLFDQNPLPNDSTFRLSDNNYTTTIPSNGYNTISVGAFNIRSCYVNMKNTLVNGYEVCRPTYFTSRGPTLDGRIKPDLFAPGENVITARSRFINYLDYEFVIDSNTQAFGGTSASSPIVAGAAALLWQKFPLLARDSIKALLKNNTEKDYYTEQNGPTPNNISGWGKLNVFKAMTGIALPPLACNTPDICYVILPPPPPILPPPAAPAFDSTFYLLYPNPANASTTLYYRSENSFSIQVMDAGGRKSLPDLQVAAGISSYRLFTQAFAPGVYFVRIVSSSRKKTKWLKLLVLR